MHGCYSVKRRSHIKPWRDCNADEKTNPRNGLCLNALHDMAYDKGFMTVGIDFKIHISSEITDVFYGETVDKFFNSYEGKKIISIGSMSWRKKNTRRY